MNHNITEPTGGYITNDNLKVINYKLGDYNIVIKLNEKNEFIGIEKISVDKIFYSYDSIKTEHNVARLYED